MKVFGMDERLMAEIQRLIGVQAIENLALQIEKKDLEAAVRDLNDRLAEKDAAPTPPEGRE